MDYPSFEKGFELLSVFNDEELLSIVGIEKKEFEHCYDKGSFALPGEELKIYKEYFKPNPTIEKIKKNSGSVTISRAVLSKKTLKKSGRKKSKYKGTIFHTGHILGEQLVGNIEGFDATTSNEENIFPQSEWSNNGNNNAESSIGINLTYCENEIRQFIQENDTAIIYYQVSLLYYNEEEVPRFIHIQAISDNRNFDPINRLIPNIDSKYEIDYTKWKNNKGDRRSAKSNYHIVLPE